MTQLDGPLADECSLCGRGQVPEFEISIAPELMDSEHRWAHKQCLADHGERVIEAANADSVEDIDFNDLLDSAAESNGGDSAR